jgi:hypothetical protein
MGYRLEFPPSSCIDLIFHVSCLKKVFRDNFLVQGILLKLDEEGTTIL